MKTIITKINESLSYDCCNHSRRSFLINCVKCFGVASLLGVVIPSLFAAESCTSKPDIKVRAAITRNGYDPISYFGSIENYASGWRTADQPDGAKHTNPQPATQAQVASAIALFDTYFKPDAEYRMESIVHSIYGFNDPKTSAYWCPHELDDTLTQSISRIKNI